jgi:preprotein translocase subunit SecB
MILKEQPALKFLGHEVSRVVYEKPIGYLHGEFDIKFEHLNHINQEKTNEFSAEIIITIQSKAGDFNLQVQTYGHFEIIGEASSTIKDNFLLISAPSIIYPYIRAFVSNLTIQTGMNPIFIPTINFGTRQQEKKTKSIED